MGDGISIDVGSALPYIVDSFLGFFGNDQASRDWKAKLNQLTKLSVQQASTVQCVGMPQPIPIDQIYQRTTITVPLRSTTIDVDTMLSEGHDAAIFAGPGWGKTTLLHWIYIQMIKNQKYLPLLFTLRWHEAIDDLENLINELQRSGKGRSSKKIVLLVDGYDEVNETQRKRVSQALTLFSSLGAGAFYLTCRTHYDLFDLKCRHLGLGQFTRTDACRFIDAYSKAYGNKVDGSALVGELERHHLEEFAAHPLMLTLVCILKSGPSMDVPRRAIGLLRRAIDTLAFRWDEAKGIHRQSKIPLDGEERIRVLMRIAFDMNKPQESWEVVQKSATAHLRLLQAKNVNARELLHEMARFYGILVPVGEDFWQFAHRIVHDYLSARYWVESGKFDPEQIHEWDIHAAYAASLTVDATDAMIRMLRQSEGTGAFTQCMYNMAPFDSDRVARAVIERLGGFSPPFSVQAPGSVSRKENVLHVTTGDGFYTVCSDEFLHVLLSQTTAVTGEIRAQNRYQIQKGCQIAAVIAMAELLNRKARVRPKHVNLFWAAIREPKPDSFLCGLPGKRLSFNSTQVVASSDTESD